MCRGTFEVFRDWSGYAPSGPGLVGGNSRRFGTSRGTLLEVWDVLVDHRGVPERVGGPSVKSGTGLGTLPEVQDWSGDTQVGSRRVGVSFGRSGRVEGPSFRSRTGKWTLREVRDKSGDAPGGPERVGRPTGRSGTGRETLGKAWGWSGDPRGGYGQVGDTLVGPGRVGDSRGGPGQVGGPFRRFGTGRRTFGEVWDGAGNPPGGLGTGRGMLLDVLNGSGGLLQCPGRVRIPSGRSMTVRGSLEEVRYTSGNTPGGPELVGRLSGSFGVG